MDKNIWIFYEKLSCEAFHVLQLLNKANQLAYQIGAKVTIVYIGNLPKEELTDLSLYGSRNVIYYKCKKEDVFVYAKVLAAMVREKAPNLIIFPSSSLGKTLAASLSSRFEAGLTADCIEIDYDEEGVVFSRAALNHTVIAKIKGVDSKLQMCTVKQNVFEAAKAGIKRELHIEDFVYKDSECRLPLVEIIKRKERENKVNPAGLAKVIFSVGRGIGNRENYNRVLKIAQKLKVEVFGTRAAVEEGYIEKFRQVGQSGINISPDLYVGFGISGASQHMVGIKNAKTIIAVNSDNHAPIFDYSDYAIIDNVSSVLEELEQLC